MEGDFLKKFTDYAKAYDVVVLGDGDLSYVNELLYEITHSSDVLYRMSLCAAI